MRVLVATDLSHPADEALRQAASFAGENGALAAVHVLPALQAVSMLFPQAHSKDALDVAQLTGRATDAVRERLSRVTGRHADVFVEEGTDYAEIVRRAETWKADIIVVGSHGRSGLARVFGGVAERVVRHAHCRVLVARETAAHGCVLAATDLSAPSLPAVVAAAEESQRRAVPLKIVHAVDFLAAEATYLADLGTPSAYDPSGARDPASRQLAAALKRGGVAAEGTILDGPAAWAVVREAESVGAQLVVVGSHGKTGLKRLLLGSVAEKITRTAPCSVLVVRMTS